MTSKPRRSAGAIVAALLACALTLGACTPTSSPTSASSAPTTGTGTPVPATPTKVLNVGATLEPVSLDPSAEAGAGTPFVLLYNVYETLVKMNAKGELEPLLAKEWTVSEDRMTYTFKLADAKFASGKPVDASAVVTSLQRIVDGKALRSLQRELGATESITATDDKTVTIKLKRPSNSWLFNMSSTAGIIYDPEAINDLAKRPEGSGPYVFKEWRKGESITLARNDKYWGKPVNVRGVVFRYYADPNAMNSAMLAGQLDIISNLVSPESIGQFENNPRYRVLKGDTSGEVVLGFNHNNEALKKLEVRQAINYAIDREGLLGAAWNGQGKLLGSMVPPIDPWYVDLAGTYPFDPAKAKKLLAAAGYANGLSLRLRVPNLPYAVPAAKFILSQLAEVGIQVKLEELEPARWIDLVYQKADYDLTIVAHVEPRDFDRFANPDYYWHYNNPAYQKLVAEADAATPERQTELLKTATKLLATDAAANFLWLLPNLIITTPEVSGIVVDGTSLSFDLTGVAFK